MFSLFRVVQVLYQKNLVNTAKHVKPHSNEYKCSTGCDLIFFNKKSMEFDKKTKWIDPVFGESITLMGNTVKNQIVIKKGVVLSNMIKPSEDSSILSLIQ